MKRGLREPPLPPPEIAFADQQALAEHASRDAARQLALMEFAVLDDEHLLDEIRMVQQDAFLHHHVEADDIAVLARVAPHHAEGIAADVEGHTDDGQALRPGQHSFPV